MHGKLSLADLAARIQEGDANAEAALVDSFHHGIRLIILKRTSDPQVTADVCQETFVKTIEKLRAGEVRNPDSLPAFIRQTAVNISIQHYRKEKRYVSPEGGISDPQLSHTSKVESSIDAGATKGIIRKLLDQLAVPRDREVLRRFYLQDEEKISICHSLELSPQHFDRILYRAKGRMRKLIEQKPRLKAMLFEVFSDG